MKTKNNNIAFVLVTVTVLLFQLARPSLVLADGETPPPTDLATEVAPTDLPTTDPSSTDSVPTNISEDAASTSPTADPVEMSTPAPEAFSATAEPVVATSEPALDDAAEQPSLSEVLQEIPDNTNLVVLDANGQPMPLATQAAADAILTMDPVWCPEGQAPTPGANGCSSSFANLEGLVAGFVPTSNGTIWIQSGTDSGSTTIWILGGVGGNWLSAEDYELTLQGGWSGVSGDTTIGTNSIFTQIITIQSWNNTITVNNISSDTFGAHGLLFYDDPNIVINDSTFDGNYRGVDANNVGNISISNSTFSGSSDNEVFLWNVGNVSISDSTISGSAVDGIWINSAGNVSISNSTFSGNGDSGVYLRDVGDVSITNSTFDGNYGHGANLENVNNNVTISDSDFINNGFNGARIVSVGDVTITNSTFNGNTVFGTDVELAGDVNINHSTFDGNDGYDGAYMWDIGNVTIADSAFTGNTEVGASVYTANNVSFTNSTFDGNNEGAYIEDVNNVTITNSIISANSTAGMDIFNSNDVIITNSNINGNGDSGIYVNHANNVTITNSSISTNSSDGLDIYHSNDVTITDGDISGNGHDGVDIVSSNDVTITDSNINGNGSSGAWSHTVDNVFITNSAFNNNGQNVPEVGATFWDVNNLTVTGSTFSGNDMEGLYIENVTGNFNVNNSTFSDNVGSGMLVYDSSGTISTSTFSGNEYGVYIDMSATNTGTLTIHNNVFNGNTVAVGADASSAGSAIDLTPDCNTFSNNLQDFETIGNVTLTEDFCKKETYIVKPVTAVTILAVDDFVEFAMDCSQIDSFHVLWNNGDEITLSCVADAVARVSRVDNTALVNDLPSGFQYSSAFKVELFKNGVPLQVMPENGVVDFSLVAGGEDVNYGMLYWNEKENDWAVLNEFQLDTNGMPVPLSLNPSNPQDKFKVLKGVQHVTSGNLHKEQVTLNFTGTFVLVQH